MYRVAFVLALALVGCGEEEKDCAQRIGTYVTQFTQRTGNCGAAPEQVVTMTEQPRSVTAPCAGAISYSGDNCKMTFSALCPQDQIGPGFKMQEEGTVNFNREGTRGTGVEQLILYDGNGALLCQGTYDLTWTKR